jgi:hypothetical protein
MRGLPRRLSTIAAGGSTANGTAAISEIGMTGVIAIATGAAIDMSGTIAIATIAGTGGIGGTVTATKTPGRNVKCHM